jgi:hypothetical protein
MAGVTGQVTTFDRPNFVGLLNLTSPTDTPLVTMLGGERGGRATQNKLFTWQTEDLEATDTVGKVEGGNPDYAARIRAEVGNVVQITYRGVQLTYSAMGNLGLLAASAGLDNSTAILGENPVVNEMVHQLQLKLLEIKRSMEVAFLSGTYQNPATNATARQTRGILTATTTNAIALNASPPGPVHIAGSFGGGNPDAVLGEPVGMTYVDNMLKNMFDNGAPLMNVLIFANSFQRIAISKAYSLAGSLNERSRVVGGMAIDTIVTDTAGEVGIVLDRWMPTTVVAAIDIGVCMPRWFEVPNKGFLFVEEKPADGSALKNAIYGEYGIEYGWEGSHGKLTNLAITSP